MSLGILIILLCSICLRLAIIHPEPYDRIIADHELGVYLDGFYDPEINDSLSWRWSKPQASINMPVFGAVGSIIYSVEAFAPNERTFPVTFTTNWNDHPIHVKFNHTQPRIYHLLIPHTNQSYQQPELRFQTNSFTPNNDQRQIGLGFTWLKLTPLTQSPLILLIYCLYVVLITLMFAVILFLVYKPLIWLLNLLLFGLVFTSPVIIQQIFGYQWILLLIVGFILISLNIIDRILKIIYNKLNRDLKFTDPNKFKIVISIIGSILLYITTRSVQAYPSLMWMNMFHFEDIPTLKDTIDFYRNLQTGIPPILSFIEIASYQLTNSTQFAHFTILHIACIITWLIIVWFPRQSFSKTIFSSILGFIFIVSVVRVTIHSYDLLFPCFIIYGIAKFEESLNSDGKKQFWVFFKTGFALSMAELLRPFGLIIIFFILIIIFSIWIKRCLPKKLLIPLIAPLIMFSGTWHLWLLINYGQIIWTNNSGFNLVRAWKMVPIPELVEEIHNQPIDSGHWDNWNTSEHTENSNRLTQSVIHYIATHPVDSVMNGLYRVGYTLWEIPTSKYKNNPQSNWFILYRPLARIAGILWILALLVEVTRWKKLATLDMSVRSITRLLVLVTGTLTIVILALGEAGEESRFLASILPFLALLPLEIFPDAPLDTDTGLIAAHRSRE